MEEQQLEMFEGAGLLVGFCPQCGESYPKSKVKEDGTEHTCKPLESF